MNSKATYDYLLTGATGQVGRYLLQELVRKGEVAVVMRRDNEYDARVELVKLVGLKVAESVAIVIQDLTQDGPLPSARYVVNAAGLTTFNALPQAYYQQNIMLAARLAHHSKNTGAQMHQMSSVAVAEFYGSNFDEFSVPRVDPRQLNYSTSKILMEYTVAAIIPNDLAIYRLGDVIPPLANIGKDWRRTHWLSILFGCGQSGFSYARPGYTVWLGDTSEVARAISILMDSEDTIHHILGKRYSWADFQRFCWTTAIDRPQLSKWMTDIILHGPEASEVDCFHTMNRLAEVELGWTRKGDAYWTTFAAMAHRKELSGTTT